MKLKEILMDVKTYILLVVFFIGLGIAFSSYAKLPDKIKAVEDKTDKTKDEVKELASTVDKYVALNNEQKISQEKREALMLELIKTMKDK